MTNILTWNIQGGKGTDDIISIERIANEIQAMGDADVICIQEISRDLVLDDSTSTPDQIAELASFFPDYTVIFGAALEVGNTENTSRWEYGNAILSRLPVLSVFKHSLPQPAEEAMLHMPRQATEITVKTPTGPLRITTTHLEYHSLKQRTAQVERLYDIHQEIVHNEESPRKTTDPGPYQEISRPAASVLCGDFNMLPDSSEYQSMTTARKYKSLTLHDAWKIINTNQSHDPTCGIFDQAFWKEGPHCRDFFFVSDNLRKACNHIKVNTKTDASDHQPLMLSLDLL